LAVLPVKKSKGKASKKEKDNVSASDANSQRMNSKEKKSSLSKKRGSKDNKPQNLTMN
jgi:hypothetical protein